MDYKDQGIQIVSTVTRDNKSFVNGLLTSEIIPVAWLKSM